MSDRYGISIGRILHPTDFSHGSEVAFTHALRLCCATNGSLAILHVDPDPSPAVEVTADLIRALSPGPCEVRLLHVGDAADQPAISLPDEDKAQWKWVNRVGSAVTAIREVAEQDAVDLIVMTTSGRHGFFDAVRGSTTELVVQHARCPVLAVHAWSD